VETSSSAARATGDVRACGDREALPAERREGSGAGETPPHNRKHAGEAIATKNRGIYVALLATRIASAIRKPTESDDVWSNRGQ